MKKILLSLLMALSCVFGSLAEETLEFGYCGDVYTGGGMQSKIWFGVAIELPAAYCEANKGAKITAVQPAFGKITNKSVTVFVTKDLLGEPIATGTTNALKEEAFTTVELDNPVELDGSTLYVGYNYQCTSAGDYPIAFDYRLDAYCPLGDYACITKSESDLWTEESLGAFEGQLGNVCLRAVLKADKFAPNVALPQSINLPGIVRPWTDFEFTVDFRNMGTDPISSIEVEYKLGAAEKKTAVYNFETPVAPNETGVATFTGRNNQDGEVDLRAVACIMKVNGEANPLSSANVETAFSPNNSYFERRMVLEEYTGLGCGFCPRGWYGIEEFNKKVTDGSFIAIAVHNYGGGSDQMYCSAYNTWVSNYIQGAPSGTVNRSDLFANFNPGLEELEKAYAQVHSLVPEDIQIAAEFSDDKKSVIATSTMRFAKDIENANYGLSYVIVQDDLGPYPQSNYYAGGGYGPMGGFESKGKVVNLMFNDVARDIYNWAGDKTAVPTSLKEGEEYTHEKTMSLSRCTTLKNASLDKVSVVVLLIDRGSGEIVNAAKCKIGEKSVSSVEKVSDAAYSVRALQGRIAVDGEYDSVAVYTVDGASAGLYTAGEAIELPAGIYLVSVDGEKAAKVIVK